MKLLRDLIREEIRKLIQDDALFRRPERPDYPGLESHRDNLGLEDEFDEPGDHCPDCEISWPDPCPGHSTLCTTEPVSS